MLQVEKILGLETCLPFHNFLRLIITLVTPRRVKINFTRNKPLDSLPDVSILDPCGLFIAEIFLKKLPVRVQGKKSSCFFDVTRTSPEHLLLNFRGLF